MAAYGGFDCRSVPATAIETLWHTSDGWPLRRLDWPLDPEQTKRQKGSMLFMPGRGDIYEKYFESFADFRNMGWSVTSFDWRGQGGSGRMAPNQYVGHISDFGVWVDDLAEIYAKWQAETPGPHVVVGHSMGGHLIARALVDKLIDPVAAVLVAPMLGVQSAGMPIAVGHFVARLMSKIGNPERHAWKVSEKPASPMAIRQTLLSHDMQRYNDEIYWWHERPETVMGPASWRWVERAYASIRHIHAPGTWEGVDTPVLLLGTTADQLVKYSAIAEAARRLPHAQLLTFGKESAHEILREVDAVRDVAFARIEAFLDGVVAK